MSKYFKLSLALAFFFIGAAPALASTTLYGPITVDTELTTAGSPYVVSATTTPLHINAGVTLTIDAGVEITGDIEAAGNLDINGATSSLVILNGDISTGGNSTTTINNTVVNGAVLGFGSLLQLSDVVINVVPTSFNGGYAVYIGAGDFIHASTTITGSTTSKGFVVYLADMTQDQAWTNDNDIPYIIETGALLPSGINLTIQPSVVVKVSQISLSYNSGYITNHGVIDIQGSTSSPVYITSIKDDSVGGDTNGDGSATSPAPGDWRGFIGASDGSMSLDHAVVSYSTFTLLGSNFSGSNSRISSSSGAALSADHSTFTNMEIVGNSIGINACDHLVIHDSTIAGNTSGVVCGSFASSTLTNNWWGDASGPYNATFNPAGLGNSVQGDISLTVFNAPGIDYERFGEVQWLSVPASTAGQVRMQGTGSGSFALDIESANGNTITATTTFAAVPVATSTIATLALTATSSPTASSTLLVDSDGNGSIDLTLAAQQGSVVLPPAPPAVTFISTSTGSVTVAYSNLPANSQLAFNTGTSGTGTTVAGYRMPLVTGGSGTTTILNYGLAGGYYTLKAIGFTATTTTYATSASFYVVGSSNPQLTYVSGDIYAQTVTVHYANMPTNTQLVFVNTTSGSVVSGHSTALSAGSAGTSTISVAGITPYGQYKLRARDATTQASSSTYVESVPFYISDPNDEGL